MARPAGRYFASVIAKIRDAQKNERIVIDGDLKMRLRQQVMMKAAAHVQPERKSWREILAPYRSYLAVVPALGLLIVAVAGISKLPVLFTSNVVVPVSVTSQESQQNSLDTQTDQEVSDGQPHIKTFPGRLALPPTQSGAAVSVEAAPQMMLEANTLLPQPQGNQQSGQADSSDVSGQQKAVEQGQSAPLKIAQPVQNQVQPVVQIPPQSFQQGVGVMNFVPKTSAPAPVLPSVSGSTPLTSNNNGAQEQTSGGSAAALFDQSPIPAPSSAQIPSPPALSVENSQTAPVTQVAQIFSQVTTQSAQTVTKSSQTVQKRSVQIPKPAATIPSLNDIAALPAVSLNVDVYYSGNFSNDEQTVLEKSLIPRLAEGKDVSYVVVYQRDAATLVIELNFTNGDIGVYTYQIDGSGNFQLIDSGVRRRASQG